MASGNKRSYRSAFTGTGAQLDVTEIGFRPTEVFLYNRAGDEAHWQDNKADASMLKRTAAGVGSQVTTGGITPLANGFRLGADGDLNVSGEIVDFVAHD